MKSILGVERPDGGSVRIGGVEVAGWPPHRIARLGVGMVFQHSRPLHRQTVLENVLLGLLPDRLLDLLPNAAMEKRAREIAEQVGLGAVLDRRPATLPFADLRKMEIAKAIARDPKVVLVDEPFAGLTARETAAFANLIREMRDKGRAVLIVDHNVKSVAALVDRIYAMYVGERIAEGSVEEVMRDETVRRVYLGGALQTAARPESSFRDAAVPFLARAAFRSLWQGAGARRRLLARPQGRVRRHRRPQRRRQDDAVQRGLRPRALFRRDQAARAQSLRGLTAARDRARSASSSRRRAANSSPR